MSLIRDGRARCGRSQGYLARRIGVSRQWVSLVENGKTSVEFHLAVGALQVLGSRLHVTAVSSAVERAAASVRDEGIHHGIVDRVVAEVRDQSGHCLRALEGSE